MLQRNDQRHTSVNWNVNRSGFGRMFMFILTVSDMRQFDILVYQVSQINIKIISVGAFFHT